MHRGEGPNFGLTCVSTHLPPYQVFWTLYGSDIKDGYVTSSHLVDRQRTEYNNTLTLVDSSRDPLGIYTCFVRARLDSTYPVCKCCNKLSLLFTWPLEVHMYMYM